MRSFGGDRQGNAARLDLNNTYRARFQLNKTPNITPVNVVTEYQERIFYTIVDNLDNSTTNTTVTEDFVLTQVAIQMKLNNSAAVTNSATTLTIGGTTFSKTNLALGAAGHIETSLIIPIPNWLISRNTVFSATNVRSGGSGDTRTNYTFVGFPQK